MPFIIFLLGFRDPGHYLTQIASLLFCLKSDVGPSAFPSFFVHKISKGPSAIGTSTWMLKSHQQFEVCPSENQKACCLGM